MANCQITLILIRVMFYNSESWHLAWFTPAIIYFGVVGLLQIVVGAVCLFCTFISRLHQNLNHRFLMAIGVLFCAEFIILSVGFIRILIIFSQEYFDSDEFSILRSKAIVILIIHLGLKFLCIFLRIRYSEEVIQA